MKNKKTLWIVLMCICGAVFISALALFLPKLIRHEENTDKYKNSSVSQTSSASSEEKPENPIDFASLKTENADVCGWIKVNGIDVIDYPIMRSGEDTPEDFYLNHDWHRASKFAGSIYMQKMNETDFSDPVTVLYGHDMLNGSMFGLLKNFRNTEFFNNNRQITIYTEGHILTYDILSAFVYDDRHILNSFNTFDKTDYDKFLSECKNPRSKAKNVAEDIAAKATTDNRLLVLSTCTGSDTERYLVTAILSSDVETK